MSAKSLLEQAIARTILEQSAETRTIITPNFNGQLYNPNIGYYTGKEYTLTGGTALCSWQEGSTPGTTWNSSLRGGIMYDWSGAPNGDMFLGGSFMDDIIYGGEGDNLLQGGAGNDTIEGGAGFDIVDYSAATGNIRVYLNDDTNLNMGSIGTDSLVGIEGVISGSGNDTIYARWYASGSENKTFIDAGAGNDKIYLRNTADSVIGGAGIDTIYYDSSNAGVYVNFEQGTGQYGHAAGDTYEGIEAVVGSSHNDTIIGDSGNNYLDGGDGLDVASFANATAGVEINLGDPTGSGNVLINIEGVIGSSHGDTITGDASDNHIDGGAGNDILYSHGVGTTMLISMATAILIPQMIMSYI